MKKLLLIILCIATILGLSGCYSSENKKLAKEIRKEAEQIAIEHIKDKYGFNPKVESVQEIKEGSEYSVIREPTKEVQVDMSFKGHNFTTFVAGEYMNGKCYDNYEQEKLTTLLKEYMKDIFPIQELDLKITAVAGYQSGYISNMPKNLVHEKIDSNLWSVISEEENLLDVYYMVEFSSPENIAETIHMQDFEDLYFLPTDELSSIIRRIILINYWNENEIGKIKPEDINFGQFQEESYEYDKTAIYAKELKVINIDISQDGGGEQYYLNEKPIEFGDYKFVGTDNNILNIEKCTDTINLLTDRDDYKEYKEEIGCYKITVSEDKNVKAYTDKTNLNYKYFNPLTGYSSHVFFVESDYGLSTKNTFEIGDYLGTSFWNSNNGEFKIFLGKR